jgi:hypothetical protein
MAATTASVPKRTVLNLGDMEVSFRGGAAEANASPIGESLPPGEAGRKRRRRRSERAKKNRRGFPRRFDCVKRGREARIS